MLRKALRRMGQADLIGAGDTCLVPESRRERELQRRESRKSKSKARPRASINRRHRSR